MTALWLFAKRFWWLVPLNAAVLLYFKVQALQAELDLAKLNYETMVRVAEQAREDHLNKLEELQAEHAGAIALEGAKYDKLKEDLRGAAAVRDAEVAGLRDALASATSSSASAQRAADPAICASAISSLDQLGKLVGAGVELLADAKTLLAERDADVQLLKAQIAADRKACQTPP